MIEVVEGLETCIGIKKLIVSHNCVQRLKDIRQIFLMPKLEWLQFDSNPVFEKKDYDPFCINGCPNLKMLDLMPITKKIRQNGGIPSEADKIA